MGDEADMAPTLLGTLALMFGGALVCGAAPFFMRVKEAHLQTVAALGAGLLIGCALAVVIPEGFHSFAQATQHAHGEAHDHAHAHDAHDHGHEAREHEHGEMPEGMAGLVLVGGFLAMLLLDHLQHAAGGRCSAGHSHAHGHAHGHGHGGAASGSDDPAGKGKATGAPADGGSSPNKAGAAPATDAGVASTPRGKGKAATAAAPADASGKAKAADVTDPASAITGLLIHCCADGLAMGAAFLSGNARLSMIIAAAMVLHKAPMAFGLATYLMACRWTFARARGTLLAFAAAAPAATLATYGMLGSLGLLRHPAAVSLALIFSGGTFLHAATMHILPEVVGAGGHMSVPQLVAVAVGCLLPSALSWGHHH